MWYVVDLVCSGKVNYFTIGIKRKMHLDGKTKQFLEHQLSLIYKIQFLLDQLQTSTYEDNSHGRGFGSFYPDKSLNLMKTMEFAIKLELEGKD